MNSKHIIIAFGVFFAACIIDGGVGSSQAPQLGRPISILQVVKSSSTATEDRIEWRENYEDWPEGRYRNKWQVRVLADGKEVKHGKYLTFYENGKLAKERWFYDDKLHGPCKIIDEDGGTTSEEFIDGLKYGEERSWYGNGMPRSYESNIIAGKENGVVQQWYRNGKMKSERHYKDGLLNGVATFWYESGVISQQGTYAGEDGLVVVTYWYENGARRMQYHYKKARQDGSHVGWYDTGDKQEEGSFKLGQKDGLWTYWYKTGQKKSEGNYKDDTKDGKWNEWDKSGKLTATHTYKAGKLVDNDKGD